LASVGLAAAPATLAEPAPPSLSTPPEVDPLPSWADGAVKRALLAFVDTTTDRASHEFVRPEARIAAFDQDGTLWVEHPIYAQAAFALDRVRELQPKHPEWRTTQPWKAILNRDERAIGRLTAADWEHIVAVTHAGMSTEDFLALVQDWLSKATHPRFERPYTELAYLPMLELLRYLRVHEYRTYIVTGGGQEFTRAYAEHVYGVPPEQVIGSSILTRYRPDRYPILLREPKVFLFDDFGAKPVGINLFIGRRPLMAFGNSDGDAEMLKWTQAGAGARLMLLVCHDDAEREYAYGPAGGLPDAKVGRFSQALMDDAARRGWIVVSMKRDWKRIFSFERLAGR
jgi:phosphoglycolate phosphatase-like HAD superfamily hydrolase